MVRISTDISLWIDRETRDLELEKKIPDLKPMIRLKSAILFTGKDVPDIAIIDTGAHISLIPFQTWEGLGADVIADHHTGGVVPGETMPVKVGYVKAMLLDEFGNESQEIRFLAYLALTNSVNLLLGVKDMLERFTLHIDFANDDAYLQEIR
ncbi:MAG: hypothetical protein C4B59_04225 [Candidatus Methanogaster sp.]|uniref:Uncharacterized protein n=1 Tax=Candidatus Methanogaster sp. TaxID=3386292 RepID=A0AC61L4P0_9EURY|nr:MAG: hypothetical protein C4B59_04225 [ANME-2 cluster archaeon]